jgi:hypothetical protein
MFGLQGLARGDEKGEIPPDAPAWMHVAQYLMIVGILGSLASVGSWVAFGPGERAFSGSFGAVSGGLSSGIGRTVFGIGAIICWLATAGFALAGQRKLRRRSNNS